MTARTWTIRYPWPSPPLSLNQRHRHWSTRARLVATVRDTTTALVRTAKVPTCERILVALVWVPRDRRKRDEENPVPTLKAAVDGIVRAGVVPDDTSEYVQRRMPVIHPADPRDPRLLLVITDLGGEAA